MYFCPQSKQQPVVGSMQCRATWSPTAVPAESTAPQVWRVTAFGWAALTLKKSLGFPNNSRRELAL